MKTICSAKSVGQDQLAAHQMAACLGSAKSLALPVFHACDTVSAFVGHGKEKELGLYGIHSQSLLMHCWNWHMHLLTHEIGAIKLLV